MFEDAALLAGGGARRGGMQAAARGEGSSPLEPPQGTGPVLILAQKTHF